MESRVASHESRVSSNGVLEQELALASDQFAATGIADGRREALLLWSELADVTPGAVLAGQTGPPDESGLARFREAVARRARGEPRQYVVGTVGFRRLILRCDRRALIPRPETEGLVELALSHQPAGRALDLGTGSGCLALALADEGSYTEVVGVDRSAEALELARSNAERTGLSVRWEQGSWTEPVRGERFDVILTNPPYIASDELAQLDPSVRNWEPRSALDGGPDGLAQVRVVLAECPALLPEGGWLFMELDAGRAMSTAKLAQALGWRLVRVFDDLYQRPRYLAARWEPDHA